ncbi:MAG: hypothetical protein H6624_06580 [Bdellovibrionaceae bacterium]|nr:hypothetical protein [Bdellovibrionales bacterium]MCB9083990.1 hypothetical protein [Pseudobdellovibrionaceae bacterium]
MKNLSLALLLVMTTLIPSLSQAENMAYLFKTKGKEKAIKDQTYLPGNWTGSGGNGYALAFSHLAYRLHREMLMEPYEERQIQVRDRINPGSFLQAVDRTKVVMVQEPVYDRHGDEVTAVYMLPDEVKRALIEKGFPPDRATELVRTDFEFGMIKVNEARFRGELENVRIALGTIYHEYLRVMGIGENHYNVSGRTYDATFMNNLVRQLDISSASLFDQVERTTRVEDFLPTHIFDAIETEKTRLKGELSEDESDLKATLAERRPMVDEARKAFSEMGNAYADMVGSMGIVPMPFPSNQERALRGVFKGAEKGMGLQEKMKWIEVLNLRIDFLTANLERNYEFYLSLNKKRQEIFLRAIDEEAERWFQDRKRP